MKRIKQRTKRHVAFLLALLLCGQLLAGQALAFSDVGPGMEPAFQEAIAAMADRGYLCGVGGDRFAPDDTVTRAMVAAVLYRMAEEPGAYSGSFADVGARDWFREAVNWASARGIMVGVAKDRFAPNDPVTREQLMAALYRFAIYRNAAQETGMDHISSCADFTRISGYAVPAMEWAVQEGLLLLALPESRPIPKRCRTGSGWPCACTGSMKRCCTSLRRTIRWKITVRMHIFTRRRLMTAPIPWESRSAAARRSSWIWSGSRLSFPPAGVRGTRARRFYAKSLVMRWMLLHFIRTDGSKLWTAIGRAETIRCRLRGMMDYVLSARAVRGASGGASSLHSRHGIKSNWRARQRSGH